MIHDDVSETLPSLIAGAEAQASRSRRRFPRHWHDGYGIGVVVSGGHRSASGRGEVEAGQGDVITVNPGEVHDGAPVGDGPRAWRMLYLDPALVERVAADLDEAGRARREFAAPALRAPEAAADFARLFRAATAPSAEPLLLDERLTALLARLVGPPDRGRAPDASAGVRRALDRLADDPASAPSLDELAAVAGLGRFQTLRGVRKAVGLTPHAWLVQRRLALARRMLRGGASAADAAAACGFADQSHMTRLFKRNYGLTPGAFAAGLRSSRRG